MPSSVLSSDSMHIGLLAAAAHAAATNSRFTIFYNPRFVTLMQMMKIIALQIIPNLLVFFFFLLIGQAHLNLSFLWPSMLKQCIIHEFLLACDLGCCLRQKNQVFVGRYLLS